MVMYVWLFVYLVNMMLIVGFGKLDCVKIVVFVIKVNLDC